MNYVQKKPTKLSQQSGQAMLEYVLMVFVVVAIFLGIILQISRGTSRFAQNYFGDYLQCLLETGELPKLGSDDLPDTECDDSYEPFTIGSGRPASDGSGSSDSENSNADADGASGKTPDSESNDADSDSDSSNGNSSASNSGGGADRGSSQLRTNAAGRPFRVPAGSTTAGKKDSSDTDTLKGTNNFSQSGEESSESEGRTTYVPIYNNGAASGEKDEKQVAVVSAGESSAENGRTASKIIPINQKKTRDIQSDVKVELGFGDYLRYLVIGVIILAIIIVVGGQLFQFQKSKE